MFRGSNVHRDSPHYVDLFRHSHISGDVRSGVRKGACFIVGLCAFAPYMARFVCYSMCATHVACLTLTDLLIGTECVVSWQSEQYCYNKLCTLARCYNQVITHTRTRARTQARTHSRSHARMHAYTHTHTPTHMVL